MCDIQVFESNVDALVAAPKLNGRRDATLY